MPAENYPPRWKATRRRVLERDGYRCGWCGTDLRTLDSRPTVDHVVSIAQARADGWTDAEIHHPDNLVAACRDCNYSRGRRPGPPRKKNQRSNAGGVSVTRGTSVVGVGRALSPRELPRVEPERSQLWRLEPNGGN